MKADFEKQHKMFDNIRVAEQKGTVIRNAFNNLLSLIRTAMGNVSIDFTSDKLTEVNPGEYTGEIDSTLSINTEAGIKRIPFRIAVEKSYAKLPAQSTVISQLNDKLASVTGSIENTLNEKIANIEKNIAAIDKEAKKSKEPVNIGTGHNDAPSIINNVPKVIHVNKVSLPSFLGTGDTVNLNGHIYTISGSSEALSEGKDDGAQWVLKLQN